MPTIYEDEIIKIRRNTDAPIKYKAYNSLGDKLCNIEFQNGLPKDGVMNGLTNEAVIAIVIDRINCQNKDKFKSLYNDKAIECLKAALGALEARHQDRKDQGDLNATNK